MVERLEIPCTSILNSARYQESYIFFMILELSQIRNKAVSR